MPSVKKKGGAIGEVERKFILENMNKKTVEEIAEHLGRDVKVVEKVIRTHIDLPQASNQTARFHLKKSTYWKQLKEAFDENELVAIEEEYVKLVQQFREDIVASEEIQLLDLIKLGILQHRNLKGKQNIITNMHRYQRMVDDILKKANGNFSELTVDDQQNIMELNKNIEACRGAESARTVEFNELQKQKNVLFDKVMGSRDQRVTEILNSKITFAGLIKELVNRDKQIEESRFLELGKKAVDKEYNRLMQPYKYADEIIDNPIICADVVDKLEQQDKQLNEEKNESTG
ncbi:MAG TPA: hypothetical protein VFV86_06275 [Nitrososphaeraceae archaeon]|nr:hypothetical protein [Nitrososphaeraceae archaeon]